MEPSEDQSLKAVVEGYNPAPFFYAQLNKQSGSTRWLAWTGELAQLKHLVYAILGQFSPDVRVLLKVDKQDVPDGPVWTRYHGEATLQNVLNAIRANERFIFQDGYTQLCVRDSDTGEYIALDEYDVLYIYSDDDRFARTCRECGYAERTEGLISEQGHWRRKLEDASVLREPFIQALDLEEVD